MEACHLWVIALDDAAYAAEKCAFASTLESLVLKHTNLTGGADAHSGGEIFFLADGRVFVNSDSGRYGATRPGELRAAALAIAATGSDVGLIEYDEELGTPPQDTIREGRSDMVEAGSVRRGSLEDEADAVGRDPHAGIEATFGPGVADEDVERLAAGSKQLFVRSQTHVGIFNAEARGRVLTAFECLDAFGRTTMAMLAEHEVVPFVRKGGAVGQVLKRRRDALSVGPGDVADKLARRFGLDVTAEDLVAMEEGDKKIPVRLLTRLARVLALDSWRIGAAPDDGAGRPFAIQLRSVEMRPSALLDHRIRSDRLGPQDVLDIAEAAWTIATRSKLERWIGMERSDPFEARGPVWPAARPTDRPAALAEGRALAGIVRGRIGLTDDEPISDIVAFCEDRLGIPVVGTRLARTVAGAAITYGKTRGIVVNQDGVNGNPGTFRVTVAHELCHLLRDAVGGVRIDEARHVEDSAGDLGEPSRLSETRAQAFAAELLAPCRAAAALHGAEAAGDPLARVMDHFGVSATCGHLQVSMGAAAGGVEKRRPYRADAIGITERVFGRNSRWRAQMSWRDRSGTRGFERLCGEARDRNLISADTFAEITLANVAMTDPAPAPGQQTLVAAVLGPEAEAISGRASVLSQDEWTVLLDIHARTLGEAPVVIRRELDEASSLLVALAMKDGVTVPEGFRTPDGLKRRLQELQRLESGLGSRRSPPAAAIDVWKRYRERPDLLAAEVRRIRAKAGRR